MKTKISYYLSHPIQYFSPLLKEMATEFDLTVYYFSDASIKGNMDPGFGQTVKWDVPLLEGYNSRFLKNYSGRRSLSNRMWDLINPGVIATIFKDDSPIIILNGWSYFSNLLTIFCGRIAGKQIWLRSENVLNQELKKSRKLLLVKKLLLKYGLSPFINKFLYIGSESKKFFEFYGVRSSKLIYTPYSVDNYHFQKLAGSFIDKNKIKREISLPADNNIILFTGKYIEKKRPMDLLKAFHSLNFENWELVFVGEGLLRAEMEQYIAVHQLQNVVLTGFINQSEIAKYYAAADIFVMCSGMGETWGLAVNEAMNFSLPVVVSRTCGCAADLVQHGVNGLVFEEGDIKGLSGCIRQLVEDEVLRLQYGAASLSIINNFSNKHIVENMRAAVG